MRLGFALLLKFFEAEARFSESAKEMPDAAVEYVAQQVNVPAEAWADYDWQNNAIATLKRGRRRDAGSSLSMTWRPRSFRRLAAPGAFRATRHGGTQPGPAPRRLIHS
ncbi:DUF4158 domain-containing protein [Streptomyces sp. NPDC050988]|uniref:DUF4158 domain-containing protein n=1 Tax=Streptomyces sp. NPDC050988 TaxID=3365637 RepID=UPI0037B795E3